ncbi:hypothetical protein GTY65_32475 [Streptomyces sp. SID8379]|uniref:hypothetical protein n=1 Tax=unclassified Streptomyces TaxID=2593676 RepID=UPI00035F9DE2|nr:MULTISPECIES: hypothetical protein [unclassified Streptomyces]MYW68759.1 hypothetical protein [Streptomyces sp. SID8379]
MIIFYLVTVALIYFLFRLLRLWRAGLRLRTAGAFATAHCTHISYHEDSVTLSFVFSVDGADFQGTSSYMSTNAASPGEDIEIIYDPSSPENADIAACVESSIRMHRLAFWCLAPLVAGAITLDVWLTI